MILPQPGPEKKTYNGETVRKTIPVPLKEAVYSERSRFTMKNMTASMAVAVMGAAVGAAAVYTATHDQRQVRRAVRKMTRGAEKAMLEFDNMISQYTR